MGFAVPERVVGILDSFFLKNPIDRTPMLQGGGLISPAHVRILVLALSELV